VSADFFAHLVSHVVLAGAALLVAAAIGIPLAGGAVDRPLPRGVLLALAGGFRVIPSLAVLTLTIPFLGLGFAPALLALVVLALPPILVNTDVALRSVPNATLEAARGMGMTERQVGIRVRWPLALPVVAVGVRTATVEVIASATLAAFIGGGGLGDYIVSGLQTGNFPELVLGAASVAVLAILADAALGFTQRRLSLSLSPTSG
jgi:osmoprotectant transport system permease protein